MSYNDAVRILKQAQQSIATRLSEYLVDNEESFLEAAEGADLGLHNEVYDLADKLRDINNILSVMPYSGPSDPDPSQVQIVDGTSGAGIFHQDTTPPQLTLGGFVTLVESGNFPAAAGVLSHLFQISVARAGDCTRYFANKCTNEPDAINRALLIPIAVYRADDTAYKLLNELFDLGATEITCVLRATRHTLGQPT